jgi:hypothetical protein
MSIGMPGESAHEGVCISAGVVAVGACVQRKENRVRRRTKCVIGEGVEFEHDCDGVSVAREVNEVLKLIDVCLYIPFAL